MALCASDVASRCGVACRPGVRVLCKAPYQWSSSLCCCSAKCLCVGALVVLFIEDDGGRVNDEKRECVREEVEGELRGAWMIRAGDLRNRRGCSCPTQLSTLL